MSRMTIRQCMDAALQLLNQYSITGSLVPLSYNDQADTENRMLNLINDAQMQMATTVKPIVEFIEFTVTEPDRNAPLDDVRFEMPEEMFEPMKVYFAKDKGHNFREIDANKYEWEEDTLVVPDRPSGTYKVQYSRYPQRYDSTTDFDTELDNKPDTHEMIPYFVAAMIAIDENPKAYYAYYNVWETRLSRLGQKNPYAVSKNIDDVYGLSYFGGIY